MAVYHVLKDGSQVNDITGRVVKLSDTKTLYNALAQINRRIQYEREKKNGYCQNIG